MIKVWALWVTPKMLGFPPQRFGGPLSTDTLAMQALKFVCLLPQPCAPWPTLEVKLARGLRLGLGNPRLGSVNSNLVSDGCKILAMSQSSPGHWRLFAGACQCGGHLMQLSLGAMHWRKNPGKSCCKTCCGSTWGLEGVCRWERHPRTSVRGSLF
jgi:hypothetical protein